jgi:hypothetical protein|tara:strand:- start:114 stop:470 length:357 start_codon:yes stop_codon:yes gene_type:complete
MGSFKTQDSIISQAMPLTAAMVAGIDVRPAWEFENQSGALGTNLNSSVIYCGVMPADASISVILPGVVAANPGGGPPVVGQAIEFKGLQSGSILPVTVDYVTAVAGAGVTVGDFIVGR